MSSHISQRAKSGKPPRTLLGTAHSRPNPCQLNSQNVVTVKGCIEDNSKSHIPPLIDFSETNWLETPNPGAQMCLPTLSWFFIWWISLIQLLVKRFHLLKYNPRPARYPTAYLAWKCLSKSDEGCKKVRQILHAVISLANLLFPTSPGPRGIHRESQIESGN